VHRDVSFFNYSRARLAALEGTFLLLDFRENIFASISALNDPPARTDALILIFEADYSSKSSFPSHNYHAQCEKNLHRAKVLAQPRLSRRVSRSLARKQRACSLINAQFIKK
jgi:hypothetical protein